MSHKITVWVDDGDHALVASHSTGQVEYWHGPEQIEAEYPNAEIRNTQGDRFTGGAWYPQGGLT